LCDFILRIFKQNTDLYLKLTVSEGENFSVLGVIVRKIEGNCNDYCYWAFLWRQGNKLHVGFVPYPFSLRVT
jgi:hypothetical protein